MATTPTPITIVPPTSNTADAWNSTVKEAADKAGVPFPVPGAAGAATTTATTKKEDDAPTVYRATLTVNGQDMVFEDEDASKVLAQYTAAVEAAHLNQPATAAATTREEKKPAFSEAELFDISIKLQKGDVSALETYVEKSGMLDRWLESKGVSIDQIKRTTTAVQSTDMADKWEAATQEFLKNNKEYPGGAQNTYLMGIMLAELGLRDKPSPESFELAFAELKKRNMVFPVEKQTTTQQTTAQPTTSTTQTTRQATSSTAVGTHGGHDTRQPAIDPNRKFELDITKLRPHEYAESYNQLIRAGVKPEQIVIKQ